VRPDCIVLGGGLIGCAIAWRLRQRGVRVAIVERGTPGAEASSAAGGILAPQTEADGPGPFLELALASCRRYSGFVDELQRASGLDLRYRTEGTIAVALDDIETAHLRKRAAWQVRAGLELAELSPSQIARLEPNLAPAQFGLLFGGDHQVDNRRLTQAVVRAAELAGARFVAAEALRVVHDGTQVRGVELSTGAIEAEKVVLACGSWSSLVAGALAADAVEPVRGVVLEVRAKPVEHVVFGDGGYLVPKAEGLLVGSTEEHAGWERVVERASAERQLARAVRLCPSLQDAEVGYAWAGFRPGTKSGLPMLGATRVRGLFVATGHFRNGILLAPITAEALTAVVAGDRPPVDLTPFGAPLAASKA
jgi:glycine oxidase